jgi:hypothetical protein
MRNLIKRIYNKFSKKNNDYKDSIENICNNPSNDLSSYCGMEYTYNKR